MKILPTIYRGINFRSRMEARWAVFFNDLSIPYIYEPEGYDLGGLFYLPDFWLPDQKLFIEIKPEEPDHNGKEMEKARRLALFTKFPVIMEVGHPILREYGTGRGFPAMIFAEGGEDFPYLWCECPHCHRLDKQFDGRADRIKCACPKSVHGDKGYNYDSPRLVNAFEVAQHYRFWSPALS